MQGISKRFGVSRIRCTSVDAKVLRFAQGAQSALLAVKRYNVLELPVDYANCAVLYGTENAVALEILAEGPSFVAGCLTLIQQRHQ